MLARTLKRGSFRYQAVNKPFEHSVELQSSPISFWICMVNSCVIFSRVALHSPEVTRCGRVDPRHYTASASTSASVYSSSKSGKQQLLPGRIRLADAFGACFQGANMSADNGTKEFEFRPNAKVPCVLYKVFKWKTSFKPLYGTKTGYRY